MSPRLQFTRFLIVSLACHILALAAAVYLIKPAPTPLPATTPVEIVNVPRERSSSFRRWRSPCGLCPSPRSRSPRFLSLCPNRAQFRHPGNLEMLLI